MRTCRSAGGSPIALAHLSAACLITAFAGCGGGDGTTAPARSAPDVQLRAIVSNVVAASNAGSALATAVESGLAYVSLPPGSIANGQIATLRNRRSGALATTAVIDGGFDPVAIAAQEGDTIHLSVQVRNVGTPTEAVVAVPKRKRPVVVRTDPPPRKRDVSLNASIIIVFSEPIDAGTLSTGTVRLLRDATPVPGNIALRAGSGSTAEFTPASPLDPNTSYDLDVGTSIRDLDGDSLEAPISVTFATVNVLDGQIAFASTRDGTTHIWVVKPDGSGLTRLTNDAVPDSSPAWSWDGSRIAFARAGSIWVMNADGSNATQLTVGGQDRAPAWSPDGSRIVFSRSTVQFSRQLYRMNADGSGVTQLTFGMYDDQPAWSPDGQVIAFDLTVDYFGDWFTQVYVMNADGSGVGRLTSPTASFQSAEGGARWSADGAAIAFWSFGAGIATIAWGSDTPQTIYRCFFDITCAPHAVFDAHPDWSPDGSALVFGGESSLFIIDRAGGLPRQLVPTPSLSRDFDPAWSRARE